MLSNKELIYSSFGMEILFLQPPLLAEENIIVSIN